MTLIALAVVVGNWKSSWPSAACVLSRQEFAYVNDSAISSGPQVRTPSTEGTQEQYSEWNTRSPPTLHILKQNQECQGKPHVSTKVTPGVFLCLLRFETYFKFTLSATWISPSLLELPNSVFCSQGYNRIHTQNFCYHVTIFLSYNIGINATKTYEISVFPYRVV